MNLFLYRLLTTIFFPLIYLYLLYRKATAKEDKKRFPERFGKASVDRPEGKLIWFNAVSLGEINSAWTLVKRLSEKYNILVTTTSMTSAANVKDKISKLNTKNKIIHQFVPVDFYPYVSKFLKHWRPNILINVESEFWPNLFTMTKKVCSIMVLNGKMSKKSFKFWYSSKRLKESIFDSIDVCLAQSKNDYRRFLTLGVQNVQFLANIKFFVDRVPVDEVLYKYLAEKTKDKRLWLANCTHKGEEEIIAEVHKKLKKNYDNLMTILIVRHPDRIKEVKNILKNKDISFVTTSSGAEIDDKTEFYIYDKIGNLGTFFNLCKIVFIAGSLLDGIGGHTPAEAIKHDCCVITGSHIKNNYMLYKDLLNINGCIILKDNGIEGLFGEIDYLFKNPDKVKEIADNAYRKSVKNANILNEIIALIESKVE